MMVFWYNKTTPGAGTLGFDQAHQFCLNSSFAARLRMVTPSFFSTIRPKETLTPVEGSPKRRSKACKFKEFETSLIIHYL